METSEVFFIDFQILQTFEREIVALETTVQYLAGKRSLGKIICHYLMHPKTFTKRERAQVIAKKLW